MSSGGSPDDNVRLGRARDQQTRVTSQPQIVSMCWNYAALLPAPRPRRVSHGRAMDAGPPQEGGPVGNSVSGMLSTPEPGPGNEGTRGGRGSSASDEGTLSLQSHPSCAPEHFRAQDPFYYYCDISAVSTQSPLSPYQPGARGEEGCVMPPRSVAGLQLVLTAEFKTIREGCRC